MNKLDTVLYTFGKRELPYIIFCCFCLSGYGVIAQPDSSLFPGHPGFTKKANATNTLKDGVREGLWLEYVDSALYITADTNAPYHLFTYYLKGAPYREITGFYKNGKIWSELPMADGKKNGVQKIFYPDGKLWKEIPYKGGVRNGVYKEYYENGTVQAEYPYAAGVLNGIQKSYYPDGKLNLKIEYKNGQAGDVTVYDKAGHEVE